MWCLTVLVTLVSKRLIDADIIEEENNVVETRTKLQLTNDASVFNDPWGYSCVVSLMVLPHGKSNEEYGADY